MGGWKRSAMLGGGRCPRKVIATLGAMLFTVAAAGPAGAQAPTSTAPHSWPMFLHNSNHSGVASDTAIGASTAGSLVQLWRKRLTVDGFYASPVVAYIKSEYIVYAAGLNGAVKALQAASGALIWKTSLPHPVYATPAVDESNNTVYIPSTAGTLYALNATNGAVECSYTLPIYTAVGETSPGRIFSAPVIGDLDTSAGNGPVVFFGDAGTSENLNAGHEWAVTGVGNTGGGCQEVWNFTGFLKTGASGTRSGSWSPPALVTNSKGTPEVIFGSANPDDAVYALNAATGDLIWRYETTKVGDDEDVGAGPTISPPGVNGFGDGVVYVDAKDMSLYALDLLTGALIWQFDMKTDSGLTPNSVSTPALSGTNLVFGYGPYLYDLDAVTGTELWRTPAVSGGVIQGSPAISGGVGDQVVFIGFIDYSGATADEELGYQLSDGTKIFTASVGHEIWTSAAISNGVLFFADKAGYVYAYAPPTP